MTESNKLEITSKRYEDLDHAAIAAIIRENSSNDKISCPKLRQLAKDIEVPGQYMGKIAKEYGIKIVACELGCF